MSSVLVLASETTDPNLGLALGAIVVAFAGLILVLVLSVGNRPRRPIPAAPTQELGPEPPAVVDLLVGGFECDDDAIAATLVDLAARRHVDIDEVGGRVFIRPRTRRSDEALTDYESRVLNHIQGAVGADGSLPAEALSTGPRSTSERWRRDFVHEVITDAQARGLSVRRWSRQTLIPVYAAVALAAGLLWLAVEFGEEVEAITFENARGNVAWGIGLISTIVLGAVAASLTRSDAQRDTEAGRAAAGHWMGVRAWYEAGEFASLPAASVAIWDRHLAYATAVGAAPTVDRQLCFAAEHDKKAWSRHGGQYRPVRIRYWSLRPGWGEKPWVSILKGVIYGWVVAGFGSSLILVPTEFGLFDQFDAEVRRWVMVVAAAVSATILTVVLWNVVRVVLAIASLFNHGTVEGKVLRARLRYGGIGPFGRYSTQHRVDGNSSPTYYLAIDDGTTDQITAYRVRRDVYESVRQGSVVRLRIRQPLGVVTEAESAEDPVRFDPSRAG